MIDISVCYRKLTHEGRQAFYLNNQKGNGISEHFNYILMA